MRTPKAISQLWTPEGRLERKRVISRKHYAKARAVDPEGFAERQRASVRKARAADPDGFAERQRQACRKARAKARVADPVGFAERQREVDRKTRAADPERKRRAVRKASAKARAADAEGVWRRQRNAHWKRQGYQNSDGSQFTHDDYNRLLSMGDGCCWWRGCGRTPAQEKHGVLCVDHDHDTKKVRGLLCGSHNLGFGLIGDTAEGLMGGLVYVTRDCNLSDVLFGVATGANLLHAVVA